MAIAIEWLQSQVKSWGFELNLSQLSLMSAYADLLATYELANVIGTKDREQIILEHLLDSLSCLMSGQVQRAGSVIDVGTGGGLPGIPLKIAFPEIHVSLLEATEKKVRFLKYVGLELGLKDFAVLHGRAENAGREPGYREAFNLATARALAPLPAVLEYCAPLVYRGGTILAMKGQLPEEELSQGIEASSELGVELREVLKVDYITQLLQKERRLVVFDKNYATPGKFPRRVGLAKKRPLGVQSGRGGFGEQEGTKYFG